MKINEIITEAGKFDQYEPHDLTADNPNYTAIDEADKIADVIEANCGQMLEAYRNTGHVLYRGIKGANSEVVVTNIRPNRVAGYLGAKLHAKMSKYFTKLGLKANRENSIFCTTSREVASSWGDYYIIFIKDGWTGTIFNKVKRGYVYDHIAVLSPKDKFDDYNINKLKNLDPVVVTPQNLDYVLYQHFQDVLITGESYIALRPGNSITRKILNKLGIQ